MASLVYLKNRPTGITYVYVNEKTVDKTTGKQIYRRSCIGHLDESTGEIVPNNKRGTRSPPKVMSYGLDLVFSRLSEEIGLTRALQIAFSKDWKLILSCAIYCVSETSPLSFIDRWSEINVSPFGKHISILDIKDLLWSINKDNMESFMKVWCRKLDNSRAVVFSFSTVDNYGKRPEEANIDVKLNTFSFSSEYEVCFSEEHSIPLSFVRHSTPLTNAMDFNGAGERFPWLDMDRYTYVVNKSLCNDEILDDIVSSPNGYVATLPNSMNITKGVIRKYRGQVIAGDRYRHVYGTNRFYTTVSTMHNGSIIHEHLFYNAEREETESGMFLSLIDKCRLELQHGHIVVPHMPIYEKFFMMVEEEGVVNVELNSDRIMENSASAGFELIVSNVFENALESVKWMELKNESEVFFDNMKNDIDNTKLKLYLQASSDSRAFIQFIALILKTALRKRLDDSALTTRYGQFDLLKEMKNLFRVELPERKNDLNAALNPHQRLIFQRLGL